MGNVLLKIAKVTVELYRLKPWPDALVQTIAAGAPASSPNGNPIKWPLIEARSINLGEGFKEIEPGEADNLYFDFVVDGMLEAVVVWTYCENEAKKSRIVGWNCRTAVEIEPDQSASAVFE